MKKPLPVASYSVARAATVILSAVAFFVIFGVVGMGVVNALTTGVLSPKHARYLLGIGLAFAALFAGHGGAIGLLDGFSQGRVRLPADRTPPPSAAHATNPWQVAASSLVVAGLPLGLGAFVAVPMLFPNGIQRGPFVVWFAIAGGLVGAVIVFFWTGRWFLREASLAPEQRAFAGSAEDYLWQRHAIPQLVINAAINAWVGAALVPGPIGGPFTRVPASLIEADAAGTAIVLAIAIAVGIGTYARFDRRWGVSPVIANKPPSVIWRGILIPLSAVLAALLVRAVLAALHRNDVCASGFIVARGLACGIYAGAIAYWVARWNISGANVTAEAG